jgi:hypothetical protein
MVACKVSPYSVMVGGSGSGASPQTFPTVHHDPKGMATSPTTLTCKRAGYYLCLTVGGGSAMYKNGSGSALKGSYAEGGGAADYVVDYFSVGDTLQVIGLSGFRQFAMVLLGPSYALLTYAYHSTDLNNSLAFMAPARFDTDWFDVGTGHPGHGVLIDVPSGIDTHSGWFNMIPGYHLAIGKISTDGGTFLQNDSAQVGLNGAGLGLPYSNNRHQRPGSKNTTIAVACFSAVQDDTAALYWGASGTYIENLFTPFSNFFVTDCAEYPKYPKVSMNWTAAR